MSDDEAPSASRRQLFKSLGLVPIAAAQLLTFIRSSWGNQASRVTAGEVGRVRASLNAESAPKSPAN